MDHWPQFILVKIRGPELLHISHMGGMDPGTWTMFCCFPKWISKELDQRSKASWSKEQSGALIRYTGTTGVSIICCGIILAPNTIFVSFHNNLHLYKIWKNNFSEILMEDLWCYNPLNFHLYLLLLFNFGWCYSITFNPEGKAPRMWLLPL